MSWCSILPQISSGFSAPVVGGRHPGNPLLQATLHAVDVDFGDRGNGSGA